MSGRRNYQYGCGITYAAAVASNAMGLIPFSLPGCRKSANATLPTAAFFIGNAMHDHRTCRACGATLGSVDRDAVVNCPICGIANEVPSDREVALTEIESAADSRIKLAVIRRVAEDAKAGVRTEWLADRIIEIIED